MSEEKTMLIAAHATLLNIHRRLSVLKRDGSAVDELALRTFTLASSLFVRAMEIE